MDEDVNAEKPALTPPDCDVRALPFMPFEVVRFLESDLVALASPEEGWAAIRLWSKSWLQVPAGSMADDDRILAVAAGLSLRDWMNVKAFVLKGWTRAADGRLYHPVVAEKALEAWIGRLSHQRRSALGNASKYGHDVTADVAAFDGKIRSSLEMLRALNSKVAGDVGKGLRFLQGDESSPTRSVEGSQTRTENSSEGKGRGKGRGNRKELLPSGVAKSGEPDIATPPAKPPVLAKPKKAPKVDTAKGTRLPLGWFLDSAGREYARGKGFSDEDIDEMEESFRLWWPAQPGAKGRKTDWSLTWMTWVRNEKDKRQNGKSGTRSSGRPGQSFDRLQAFHTAGMDGPDPGRRGHGGGRQGDHE